MLTAAPGNGAPIGGLKVVAENGWFAARPSGTEDVYKIYAESFLGDRAPGAHPRRGRGHRAGRARGAPSGPDRWRLYSSDGRDLDRLGFGRLPDRGAGRRGRDGPGVPGDPDGAQPAGRAQADHARAGHPTGLPRALLARVAPDGVDRAPQRDPGLRGGRGRRPAVHRHALGRGDRPALGDRARGNARPRAGRGDRRAGRGGARRRARRRARAPRREAGERDAHRSRTAWSTSTSWTSG